MNWFVIAVAGLVCCSGLQVVQELNKKKRQDPCDPNPCQNEGKCIVDFSQPGNYTCICIPLTSGVNCEIAPEECENELRPPCGRLEAPENGTVETVALAKFECNPGYQLIGSPELHCSDIRCDWTSEAPICVDGANKKKANKRKGKKGSKSRRSNGSKSRRSNGSNKKTKGGEKTCKKDKNRCKPLQLACPELEIPGKGSFEITVETRFVCNHGYALVGPAVLNCSPENCQWDGAVPVCTTDPCGLEPCQNGGSCQETVDQFGGVGFTCACVSGTSG